MANAPKVADLYGDIAPKEAAARHEEYLAALSKSASAPLSAANIMGVAPAVTPTSAIESVLANDSVTKSMSPDALASLNAALDAQRAVSADIVKDITLTSPISTGLVAFDLEAPAKLLTPRPTPLRNKIVRKKGVGTSHRIKRITAFTGTGTGASNIFPGITDATTTAFGSVNYLRGPKISYLGEDALFNYKQFSLSDAVPFSAQFQGQGYQDIRQLSQTSLLYASMLMEERMLLMGRGTDSGFAGALAAPTATAAARAKAAGEVGLAAGTYYVKVTTDAGDFGQSVLSTAITVSGVTAGQVIDVTITDVAGALGYRVYAGTTNADASLFYQGRTGYNVFTIGATALATSGTAASTVTADTSAYATGYDGILPTILSDSSASNTNRINAAFSTSNPGSEFQTVFANLYNSVKADPDDILINGADRKQLSDAIKGASGNVGAYRLNITADEASGVVAGDVVVGIHNEVTGKPVSLTVHPWMPQGNAAVLSYTLPIPDTNVSEVWAVVNTQDYMAIEWPVSQFAYETSTYWNGTFVCYAPNWNGAVVGIKAA